jgi:hypothetical protein
MKVNLNNKIKVKLTGAARFYLANRHAKLFGNIGVSQPVDIKFGYDGKYISFEYIKKQYDSRSKR